MNEKDKLYLNHISNILAAELHGRMSYLGFLVTINIASFAGLHLLTDSAQSMWQFSLQKTSLLLVLIFVNFIFTIMYLREHNITRIRDKGLREAMGESKAKMIAKVFAQTLKYNDSLRGITWSATKLLLAVFNAIPVSFLLVFLCKASMIGNLKLICGTNTLFIVFVVIGIGLIYSYLSERTHLHKPGTEKFIDQLLRLCPCYERCYRADRGKDSILCQLLRVCPLHKRCFRGREIKSANRGC
jgi:hypothetical protein